MSRNGAVTTDWTYTISVLEGETIEYKYVKGGSWAQEALMNYSNPKAANQVSMDVQLVKVEMKSYCCKSRRRKNVS